MLKLLLLFSVLSAYVVKEIHSIQCYVCDSRTTPDCINPQPDDLNYFTRLCLAQNVNYVEEYKRPFCRKIDQTIKVRDNLRVVRRSCGYELHEGRDDNLCYQVRNQDHEETVCQCFSDNCNTASITTKSFYLIFICCFSVFMYYR